MPIAIISGVLLLAVAFAVICIRDIRRFRTVYYEITAPAIRKECRLAVLSDLHDRQYGEDNGELVKAVEELKPDYILIAGDLVTSGKQVDYTVARRLAVKLQKIGPVFYANGNHEQKLKAKTDIYGESFSRYRSDIRGEYLGFLENSRVYLQEHNIDIAGLEIDRKYFKRGKKCRMEVSEIEKKMGKANHNAFQVLLAHNPDYFPTYAQWGADMTCSGHLHGGIVRLPLLGGVLSPALRLFPKYDGGIFQENGKTLIVSRGLGTHTLPIRFLNPGELVCITLKPGNREGR